MAEHSKLQSRLPGRAILPVQLDGKSVDYQHWKERRLCLQERLTDTVAQPPLIITPKLDQTGDRHALESICVQVCDYGYAHYQWSELPEDINASVERLNSRLGLTGYDRGVVHNDCGLSLLADMSGTARGRFIPYTARAMGWHTDGYYNDPSQTLRCFTLHCINPAASGGSLSLMDYELLFIALHDEAPEMTALLCHNQSMTLPANRDDIGHDRPDRHSPVFFNNPDGTLGARFTTRTKHIHWRTADTQSAAERMAQLIASHQQWHHTVRLKSGQGIFTRNILHRRDAFSDDSALPPRQMLRGRYLQIPALS